MAKKAKKGGGRKPKQTDPTRFGFTTNPLSVAISNTLVLAKHVKQSLHRTAPESERVGIDRMIDAIRQVEDAASEIKCDNPYFRFFTVDSGKIAAFSPGGRAPARGRGKRKR